MLDKDIPTMYMYFNINFISIFPVLGIDRGASSMTGNCSAIKQYPQSVCVLNSSEDLDYNSNLNIIQG